MVDRHAVQRHISRSRRFRESFHLSSSFFSFVSQRHDERGSVFNGPLSEFATRSIAPRHARHDGSEQVGRSLRGEWPAGPLAHRWAEVFRRLGLDISNVDDVQSILDALLHELGDAARADVGALPVREEVLHAGSERPVPRLLTFETGIADWETINVWKDVADVMLCGLRACELIKSGAWRYIHNDYMAES